MVGESYVAPGRIWRHGRYFDIHSAVSSNTHPFSSFARLRFARARKSSACSATSQGNWYVPGKAKVRRFMFFYSLKDRIRRNRQWHRMVLSGGVEN